MQLDQAKEILTGITNNPQSCLYSQRTAIQTVLDALDKAVISPWQPIDYSQSEAGQAPFDGDEYLLKMCDGYVGDAFVLGTWTEGFCDAWYTVLGVIQKENVCEWMQVPEFMKG